MPPHDKPDKPSDKPSKKITALASDLATAAMTAKMWETNKPEDIAIYCLSVATAIVEFNPDEDSD